MSDLYNVTAYYHLYVNNTYNNFYRSILDMFRTEWFGRTKEVVISTYEKALEKLKNEKEKTGSNWAPSYPFITFNPNYDIEPDELVGLYLYQYPNLAKGLGSSQWDPRIYQDENLYIAPCLNRYKGEIEMILWCSSVYELFDYRTRLYQLFGGLNRIIQPTIEGYFVLPDELVAYNYTNPYTKENYTLDWDSESNTQIYLIKNINQNKRVYPFLIKPFLRLTNVSDGSDKYGGSGDFLSDHRLVVTIGWESWIPVHLVMVSNFFPIPCKEFWLDLMIGFQTINVRSNSGGLLTAPIHDLITYVDSIDDATCVSSVQLEHSKSYCYLLTQSDKEKIDNDEELIIEIDPDLSLPDCLYVRCYSKFGELARDFQYNFVSPNKISFVTMNLHIMEAGDMITFEIYGKEQDVDRSINTCS